MLGDISEWGCGQIPRLIIRPDQGPVGTPKGSYFQVMFWFFLCYTISDIHWVCQWILISWCLSSHDNRIIHFSNGQINLHRLHYLGNILSWTWNAQDLLFPYALSIPAIDNGILYLNGWWGVPRRKAELSPGQALYWQAQNQVLFRWSNQAAYHQSNPQARKDRLFLPKEQTP